jgi:hypothetical protein
MGAQIKSVDPMRVRAHFFFRENAKDLRFDALIDRKGYMYMSTKGPTPRTTTRPKKGDLV